MINELLFAIYESFDEYIQIFIQEAPHYIVALSTFFIFYIAARIQRSISLQITKRIENNSTKTLSILITRIIRASLIILGSVIALSIVGINWTALATGLGLVGFGVSFAFKDYIENFLAGVIILTQQPFTIGDQVMVGDIHGIIQEIATRYTVIKDFDGKQVIVPNANMLATSITKDNSYGRRRYSVSFDIDVDSNLQSVVKDGQELVEKTVGVLTKPVPYVVVTNIQDGKVSLTFFFWAHPREEFELAIRSKIYQKLLRYFERNSIELGYTTSRIAPQKTRSKKRRIKKSTRTALPEESEAAE